MYKGKRQILAHQQSMGRTGLTSVLGASRRGSRRMRSGIDATKPATLVGVAARDETRRWKARHGWLSVAVAGLSAFGMAAAIAISPQTAPTPVRTETIVEPVATTAPAEEFAAEEHVFWREDRVLRSDSLSSLLARMGISDKAFADFVRTNDQAKKKFVLGPGSAVSARTTDKGEVLSFYLPLDGDRNLVIERQAQGAFSATDTKLTLEAKLVMKSGEIQTSLFAALDATGLPDGIATQLSEIFASQIDFHNELRRGDKFTVVFESFYHQGRPVRSGRILAAEFLNGGESHRALYFTDANGRGNYYTPQGKNLKQSLLRSPLEFSRITSGFSSSRLHPVLGYSRAHVGVDFGAPTGTPVRATADGTVDFVGRQSGYGNIVILSHAGKVSTYYAHLNSFTSGLSKGDKVAQGDEIGKVGRTGIATGPHLHYEVRIDDVPQNPVTVAAAASPHIPSGQFTAFKERSAHFLSKLDLLRNTNIGKIE